MGKIPVRMKAVVYGLSPFQQKVMPGLWKDLHSKIHHKISDNWISATLLLGPLIGTSLYVQHYQEQEKLAHRNGKAVQLVGGEEGEKRDDEEGEEVTDVEEDEVDADISPTPTRISAVY